MTAITPGKRFGKEEHEMLAEKNIYNALGVFISIFEKSNGDYKLANQHARDAHFKSIERFEKRYSKNY